ncbi:alpha/beta-hydrolase [Rhizopus microsporus var. microsporus]|uniref:Alpha/beta-hydrolase n=2 Tax=Rhizopus microsporus TaxID=58291 RepID=A0A2G4T7S2_RHIZD|nr:alpha/beta-hydrolase [Rhizopus microsporus ATCC 52813]ORE08627.1 alpha/beta-hydrolase [Rhizopus microsporus var. microsporus]PHZ17080.1 alpha/beta-hydrolase [Rhizopus microsporus ATCC 52813]
MSQVTVIEEWIRHKDGNEIYTKIWKATTPNPIATLVMVHGFGEHVGRHDRVLASFASSGIECYGYDQRGWGETGKKSGQFGNNQGYDTLLQDIDDAVLKTKRDNLPLFLMGHSMGGGLILNYLSRGDKYQGVKLVTGAIAASPLIELSMPIPALKYYGLRMISNLLPHFVIRADLDASGMSHDQDEVKRFKEDPLVHDYATLATLKSMIDAGSDILKTRAKLINCPILYSHGDEDNINSHIACVKAYELTASKDKEMKSWKSLYHELHNESLPHRDQVIKYYIEWITNRCN